MSLGIAIKSPEGIVLAADSRITLMAQTQTDNGVQRLPVNFDNVANLLTFSQPNSSIGVVTYGQAVIGQRTANSFLPELEQSLSKERLSVESFAAAFSDFYMRQWRAKMPSEYLGPDMTFKVGGYDEGDPYGKLYSIDIPHNPIPIAQMENDFGISYSEHLEVFDRLLLGYDRRFLNIAVQSLGLSAEQINTLENALTPLSLALPLRVLSLQDCVDLAIFAIRSTISAQKLSIGLRSCGGPIDVITITSADGLKFIQRKQIQDEISVSV